MGRSLMQQAASAGKESSGRRSSDADQLWRRRGALTVMVSAPAIDWMELERKRGRPRARACSHCWQSQQRSTWKPNAWAMWPCSVRALEEHMAQPKGATGEGSGAPER